MMKHFFVSITSGVSVTKEKELIHLTWQKLDKIQT